MRQDQRVYDNAYAEVSVYSNAAKLIQKHAATGGEIHLDIGCGYGRIAEALGESSPLTYVGVDMGGPGLASLRERGIEAHEHVFGDLNSDLGFLRSVLGERKLSSISALDVLEHLVDPEALLKALRALAGERRVPLIVSVPNVAHRDVGFKLAFGQWDYTEAGLLDQTHLRFFTSDLLRRVCRRAGWHEEEANDFSLESSDQRFPSRHLALSQGAQVHGLLSELRNTHADAIVNQFVRAYLPGEETDEAVVSERDAGERPFLSVVMRTQARRLHTLKEALLCLSAQSCDDFEVVLVGHRIDEPREQDVRALIASMPESFAGRIRLVPVDHGNRTTPLNVGFQESRGHYIAMLDDDDVPFAHWVETFLELAKEHPGRMVRAVSVRQDFDEVQTKNGSLAVRAVSGMQRDYPGEFDLLTHLRMNQTPNHALAFPRSIFHDFNLRFDESLTTTEDWDFLMRAAFICGVASRDEVTCIYRWWRTAESSRTAHDDAEWSRNLDRILAKFDQGHIVLPPGSASRLRDLVPPPELGGSTLGTPQTELIEVLSSKGWRITSPLRIFGHLVLGNPPPVTVADVLKMNSTRAQETLAVVRNSKSLRVADRLRHLRNRLR